MPDNGIETGLGNARADDAADVAGKSLKVTTAAGLPVNVYGTFGVRFNDAHVIQPDIEASNGVIHVIDTVLLPPAAAAKRKH